MKSQELTNKVALALHSYLLGEVTGNIFAIAFCYEGPQLDVIFYMYENPTVEELDDLGAVAAETLSGLSPTILDVEFFFVPVREYQPKKVFQWLFMRKDPEMIRRISSSRDAGLQPRLHLAEFSESAWQRKYTRPAGGSGKRP